MRLPKTTRPRHTFQRTYRASVCEQLPWTPPLPVPIRQPAGKQGRGCWRVVSASTASHLTLCVQQAAKNLRGDLPSRLATQNARHRMQAPHSPCPTGGYRPCGGGARNPPPIPQARTHHRGGGWRPKSSVAQRRTRTRGTKSSLVDGGGGMRWSRLCSPRLCERQSARLKVRSSDSGAMLCASSPHRRAQSAHCRPRKLTLGRFARRVRSFARTGRAAPSRNRSHNGRRS